MIKKPIDRIKISEIEALLKHKINFPMTGLNIIRFMVIFLIIVPTGLSGQKSNQLVQSVKQDNVPGQNHIIGSIEEYLQSNQSPPGEKVFLHTDRLNYMQGDTIWFKAYLWYGYDQMPDTVSGILYVDLINPEGKIKLKRKLLLENGTSHGDFCLDTTIGPGRYRLRSYTNRMHNLNTGEPFYQTIIINPTNQNFQVECVPLIVKQTGNDSLKVGFTFFEIDQTGDLNNSYNHNVSYSLKIGDQMLQSGNIMAVNAEEQVLRYSLAGLTTNDSLAEFGISIRDSRLTFQKQFRIPLKERIDLQFFPEGGIMVNGLKNRVAFKAIGTDGLSREVKGEIRTGEDEVITSFESSHKGMGAFLLNPKADEKYFAHIWYNNLKYVIPLPAASEEGCTMSVGFMENGNDPLLTIKQRHLETTTQKYVVGSAYGKIWFSALVKMAKDSCRFQIPMELLPEGVCRLTVLDRDFKPECERLIYVDKRERFKIEVIPDSSSYRTRSKVTLLIKTTGPDGAPVQTDLSLTVVDKEQTMGNTITGGICAYKLLESELQGYIEDAGFYFRDDSVTNQDALDLLMLTQGYRKFLPGNTKPDELKFQPERNFEVSGNIKFGGSKSREKKFDYRAIGLSLICFSDNPYIGQFTPDSAGQFRYQIPLRYGQSKMVLQATTARKKPFYGDINVNEPIAPPQFAIPLVTTTNIAQPVFEFVRQLQAAKKTEMSKIIFDGGKTLNLPEVVVTARAKNWYQDFEPNAKKIIALDTLDPQGNKYLSVNDLLIKEFGAEWFIRGGFTTLLLPCFTGAWDNSPPTNLPPIYLINGKVYWNGNGMRDKDGNSISNIGPLIDFIDGRLKKGESYYDLAEQADLLPLLTLNALKVSEIKKIMVLPPGSALANYYRSFPFLVAGVNQSLVVIETYSEDGLYRGDAHGIKTFILNGLDAPRVFYSPRYEGPSKKSFIYDERATLFWEPSIKTDSSGQAKVEFFTNDRKTSLEVIVNGIEIANGNPGQGQALINSNFHR
jgi:hypothetical protein